VHGNYFVKVYFAEITRQVYAVISLYLCYVHKVPFYRLYDIHYIFYTILSVVLPAVYFKFLQAHATMCLGLYSSYDEECACNYYHHLMRHLSLLHTFCSAADDVWLSFATFGTDSFS